MKLPFSSLSVRGLSKFNSTVNLEDFLSVLLFSKNQINEKEEAESEFSNVNHLQRTLLDVGVAHSVQQLSGDKTYSQWVVIEWDPNNAVQRGRHDGKGIAQNYLRNEKSINNDFISFLKLEGCPSWCFGFSLLELIAIKYGTELNNLNEASEEYNLRFIECVKDSEMTTIESNEEVISSENTLSVKPSLWDTKGPIQRITVVGAEQAMNRYRNISNIENISLNNSLISRCYPLWMNPTCPKPIQEMFQTKWNRDVNYLRNFNLINEFNNRIENRKNKNNDFLLPELTNLDLSDNITLNNFSEILLVIAECPKLKSLSLSGCHNLFENEISQFSVKLDTSTGMYQITSFNNSENENKMRNEIRILNIDRVVIPRFNYSSNIFNMSKFISQFENLQSLRLSSNSLSLQNIKIIFENASNSFISLKELHLADNRIDSIESLLPVLRSYCPCLLDLSLSDNPLEWSDSVDLSVSTTSILSLSLNNCNIPSINYLLLLSFVFPNLKSLRVARNFEVHNYSAVSQWIVCMFPHLESLNGSTLSPKTRFENEKFCFHQISNCQNVFDHSGLIWKTLGFRFLNSLCSRLGEDQSSAPGISKDQNSEFQNFGSIQCNVPSVFGDSVRKFFNNNLDIRIASEMERLSKQLICLAVSVFLSFSVSHVGSPHVLKVRILDCATVEDVKGILCYKLSQILKDDSFKSGATSRLSLWATINFDVPDTLPGPPTLDEESLKAISALGFESEMVSKMKRVKLEPDYYELSWFGLTGDSATGSVPVFELSCTVADQSTEVCSNVFYMHGVSYKQKLDASEGRGLLRRLGE